MAKKRTHPHLPPEIMQLVISRLPQNDLRSLSLVSKSFLSLSNNFVRKLIFETPPSDQTLQSLSTRFPSIEEITLSFDNVDDALISIFNSNLNIETLRLLMPFETLHQETLQNLSAAQGARKLKSLYFWFDCAYHRARGGTVKVVEFLQLFSTSLLELDLRSYRDPHDDTLEAWDDDKLGTITSQLPILRKIDLSGGWQLTDHALRILCSNCVDLDHVGLTCRFKLTLEAVSHFLRDSPNMSSLVIPRSDYNITWITEAAVLELIQTAKGPAEGRRLRQIALGDSYSKILMVQHSAEASVHLVKLGVLQNFFEHDYTITDLSRLLMLPICNRLETMNIAVPLRGSIASLATLDLEMSRIVRNLPCLKHVDILSQRCTYVTLFSLIEHCPLLETLSMMRSSGGVVNYFDIPRPTKMHYDIKSIRMTPKLDYHLWKSVLMYCPNLRKATKKPGRT